MHEDTKNAKDSDLTVEKFEPKSLGDWFARLERYITPTQRRGSGLVRLRHDCASPRLWRPEFLQFLEGRGFPAQFLEPPAAPEPPSRIISSDESVPQCHRSPDSWYGVLKTRVDGRDIWLWSLFLVGPLDQDRHHEFLILAERAEDVAMLIADYRGFWFRNSAARSRDYIVVRGSGRDSIPRELALTWDDLVLRADLREDIRTQVAGFLAGPERFRRLGLPHRRGFLLVGPPGNGKSTFCRVLAAVAPLPFLLLKPAQHTDDSDLDFMFQEASALAPSILCFEDIDSLFQHSNVSLSRFLNLLDGMDRLDGLLVVATTNHPEALDPALKDRPVRFDRVWHFGNPGPKERETVLRKLAAERWSDAQILLARDLSDGLSIAHIREIYATASLRALDRQHDQLDFIRQAGLPVLESVDPERRKRYKLDPKRLPAAHVSFEPLEAAALHVAAALMQAMEGLPLAKEIERVRAKVASAVPAAFRPELDRFVTALAAAPSGRHDYRAFGTHFLNLMDAVAERWPVMIDYRRPDCDEAATHRVEPYLVHCHADSVYLVGRRTDRNELRNYALGRIEGLRVLDEDTFDPDPAFNAARYVDEGFGGFHEGELVDVAVHFAPAAATVALERRWHSSQRHEIAEDGSAVLRFRTAGPAGVLYWAMSYLPHARVIEPAPLAERQREIVEEWLQGTEGPT